jgi:hypothetical protein
MTKLIIVAGVLCAGLLAVNAADRKKFATPGGGRLLEKTSPHAEFVIEKDRSVTINFYADDLKPVAVTTQKATVIATPASGKTTIEFESKGNSLVGKTKLPAGEDYNLVVQFKQTAEAKPKNFRFKFDLATCGECRRAEYACICGH